MSDYLRWMTPIKRINRIGDYSDKIKICSDNLKIY
jgi:hypothetical protein